MPELIDVPAGLHHVAVTTTEIGDVHGDEGFYHYREYDATGLARSVGLEDVWFLFERGRLPDLGERERFGSEVAELRHVPESVAPLLAATARSNATPLARLRTILSALDGDAARPMLDLTAGARSTAGRTLAAAVPAILAGLYRAEAGRPSMPCDPTLGHGAAYLQAVTGVTPTPEHARALEQYLILTIDHGFNASTFTGRVVASTGASVVDAVCAAIGALAGPLHGGAPSRALDALDAIGTPERAADWVRAEVRAGRRIMGFGHAVYRAPDPRSALLRSVAISLGGELVERAIAIETEILATLAQLKPDRPLPSNVEFYAGVIMATVGLPRSMFTPTFAVSRTIGWCAHAVEQAAQAKLIRPSARYVGPLPNRLVGV
jgi:citrate synthase